MWLSLPGIRRNGLLKALCFAREICNREWDVIHGCRLLKIHEGARLMPMHFLYNSGDSVGLVSGRGHKMAKKIFILEKKTVAAEKPEKASDKSHGYNLNSCFLGD